MTDRQTDRTFLLYIDHHNSHHNQITIIIVRLPLSSSLLIYANSWSSTIVVTNRQLSNLISLRSRHKHNSFAVTDRVHRVRRIPLLGTNTNIVKGTTDPLVEFCLSKSLQNLNQTSTFQLNLNFKILTKPSFRISTKIKLHNLNQASTAKY